MAQTVGPVASLRADRVRSRRWEASDTDLQAVIDQLRRMEAELRHHDTGASEDHPHPRNCVLNLVVTLPGGQQRLHACDRLLTELSAAHPMRAILLHVDRDDAERGTLGATLTVQAHQLLNGFPVQREQVLLHVPPADSDHLASLVEPLLVADVPTFVWWSGHAELDDGVLGEVIQFADVLVVDSTDLERPVDALLRLAAMTGGTLGLADLHWGRLRPWQDAIAQFFAPSDRRRLLGGLISIRCESAGTRPGGRAGAALLVGWAAAALGWSFVGTAAAGESTSKAVAETEDGRQLEIELVSVPNDRLTEGELVAVRAAGQADDRPFLLSMERDLAGGDHAHVTIDIGGSSVRQTVRLPRMGDSDLLLQVLWAGRRNPAFENALASASVLLEALR